MSAIDILRDVASNPQADIVYSGENVVGFADMMASLAHLFNGRTVATEEQERKFSDGIARLKTASRIVGYLNPPPNPGEDCGLALRRHWFAEYEAVSAS